MSDQYQSKATLLAAAASLVASSYHAETRTPGPNDDADAEYNDDRLLAAARAFVEAHHGQSHPEGDLNTGVILVCPNCGSEHRRRYAPVGFLNAARGEIERLRTELAELRLEVTGERGDA